MNELIKLLKNKLTIILWFTFIIIICFISILYVSNTKATAVDETTFIYKYETQEELKNIIDDLKYKINTAEYSFEDEKQSDEEELAFYEHLYDNDIAYGDFRIYSDLNQMEYNKCCFTYYLLVINVIFVGIILILLSNMLFNEDFSCGIYKYVYTRNKTRMKVIFNKMLIYYGIVAIIFVVLILTCLIISPFFYNDYTYFIFTNGKDVVSLTQNEFLRYFFIFYFLDLLFHSTLYLIISLLFKGKYKSLCFSFILYLCIILCTSVEKETVQLIFSSEGFSTYMTYLNMNKIIISYVIKFFIVSLGLASSMIFFNKKNL